MKTRLLKILRFIARHKVNVKIIDIAESGIRVEIDGYEQIDLTDKTNRIL